MPLAIDVTVGGASANSYATKEEADSYAAEVFPASEVEAWGRGSVDDQSRALVQAAQLLDQEHFPGQKASDTQKRAWPRADVTKSGAWSSYLTTEIPEPVKRAQARLAFFLVKNVDQPDVFSPSDSAGVSSFSLGSELSMSFEAGQSRISTGRRFFAEVIRPILGELVYAPSSRVVRG